MTIKNYSGFNAKKFWNEKILRWEISRYGADGCVSKRVNLFARFGSDPVALRQNLAKKILMYNCLGKNTIEFGCGTAYLAEPLIDAGATSYIGIDLAPAAINSARQRVSKIPNAERIILQAADIATETAADAEIVISLGLTDWLDDDQLDQLISLSKDRDFLHSFSEQRSNFSQWIHKLYVYLAYGWKTNGYVPRYYELSEIVERLKQGQAKPITVIRLRELSFGVLVTSLNIPPALR